MTDEPRGANGVRAMFDAAEEFAPDPEDPGDDAGDDAPERPRRQKGPPWTLPADCPVMPLGINGKMHYYLDASNQLSCIRDKEHSRGATLTLFGKQIRYLYEVWPRLSKNRATGGLDVTGWRPEAAEEALKEASAQRGVWDVFGRVRGPGAWREEDGRLAFHCGDTIWLGPDEARRPGLCPGGRYVYPAAAAIPRPAEERQPPGEDGPAWRLLELLKTWNWKRGETDAILLLGWHGAAILGGALDWRPLAWITGGAATGKSTLHQVIKQVMGDAILSTGNATAAGIWQVLEHASLPVAIDEIEAREDNRRAQAIIELAREAASGSVMLRGGADHQGSQFTARSCFLFSSILIPPLLTQDIRRMALLELGRLSATEVPALVADRPALRAIGRGLRRRLADGWHRWPETLEAYRQQLAAAGHNAGGADQFGTLLAAADLVLFDEAPNREADEEDRLAGWTERLSAAALKAQSDDAPDEERCLAHLLSTPADVWRGGGKLPIARYVRRAAGLDADDGLELAAAIDLLGNVGLRVERLQLLNGIEEHCLAVANTHQGLAKVFEGSHWAGRAGATGGWRQSLLRLEGARPLSDYVDHKGRGRVTLSFGGVPCRAVCVPIALATGEGGEA